MKKRQENRKSRSIETVRALGLDELRVVTGGGGRGEDAYFVRCDRSTISS